jgi:hypothetical protein
MWYWKDDDDAWNEIGLEASNKIESGYKEYLINKKDDGRLYRVFEGKNVSFISKYGNWMCAGRCKECDDLGYTDHLTFQLKREDPVWWYSNK